MSLLLDALKKAADDKQKVSQGSSVELSSPPSDLPETGPASKPATESTQELNLLPVEDEQNVSEGADELTLDVLEVDAAVAEENIESHDELTIDDVAAVEADTSGLEQEEEQKKPEPMSYTVSDEALSMLINKTNRDVKHNRRIVILSMLLLSLVVLVSGGFYYYMDMQEEIAMLERKHQIAMQSMRSKTGGENASQQSEIIRNLVSDSGLDDKVQYAKERIADEKSTRQVQPRPAATASKVKPAAAASVSFKKTNTVDPIEEKLEAAWSTYDDGQYGRAKELYAEVLEIEDDNRDALLGLGAIAVIEKDNMVARDIYLMLLQQDPRDPIAISALASMQYDEATLEADEKYLTDMLQKSPDAPHLNFALGNVYAQQEKWKSAQQSYFNAWQHDIENADYIFNLAVSMDQLGKQQQAVGFYRDSLNKAKNKQVSFSREAVQKRITELSEL